LDFGLIAEEVEKVVPELVGYSHKPLLDKDGKPAVDKDGNLAYSDELQVEGVKYDHIGVLLLGIIKEHDAIIQELQATIKRQQLEIDALKNK
jgi:hypothetical protein